MTPLPAIYIATDPRPEVPDLLTELKILWSQGKWDDSLSVRLHELVQEAAAREPHDRYILDVPGNFDIGNFEQRWLGPKT